MRTLITLLALCFMSCTLVGQPPPPNYEGPVISNTSNDWFVGEEKVIKVSGGTPGATCQLWYGEGTGWPNFGMVTQEYDSNGECYFPIMVPDWFMITFSIDPKTWLDNLSRAINQ